MSKKKESKTLGNLVYRFATPYDQKADILYVNVVPEYSCSNTCRFCSRTDAINGEPNIYEQKAGANLYLPKVPSVEEVVKEIESHRKKGIHHKAEEIAFVGLGEPLLQFELVRDAIRGIRNNEYNEKIRVDTNGLVKCWYDSLPAKELKQAGLNEIRISVNATSEKEYQKLCRPHYVNAFEILCEFVKECITEGIDTKASFVTCFDDGEVKSKTPEEYRNFASSLGINPVNIILREYVNPIKRKK